MNRLISVALLGSALLAGNALAADSAGEPGRSSGKPNPLNNVYFGEQHLHTSASADAYIQGNKDKESNWLPAPEGPFWPIMRTYGPEKAILDKTWKLPVIKRVD